MSAIRPLGEAPCPPRKKPRAEPPRDQGGARHADANWFFDSLPLDVFLDVLSHLQIAEVCRLRGLRRSLRAAADSVASFLLGKLLTDGRACPSTGGYDVHDLPPASQYQLLTHGCCRAPVHTAVQKALRSTHPVALPNQPDDVEVRELRFTDNVRVIWSPCRTFFAISSTSREVVDLTEQGLQRTSSLPNIDPVLTVFEKTGEEVARARLYDLYKVGARAGDTGYYWPPSLMHCANDCTRFSTKGDKILIGAAGKIVVWNFQRFSSPASSLRDYNELAADPFYALPSVARGDDQSEIVSLETSPDDEFLCCVIKHRVHQVLPHGFEEHTRLYSLTNRGTIYTDPDCEEGLFVQPETSNSSEHRGRFNFTNRPQLSLVGPEPSLDDAHFDYNPACRVIRAFIRAYEQDGRSEQEAHGLIETLIDTSLLTGFHCDPKPGSWQFSATDDLMAVLDVAQRTVALSSVTKHPLRYESCRDNCAFQNLHHLRFEGPVDCAFFLPAADAAEPPGLVALMKPQAERTGPDCALFEWRDRADPEHVGPRRASLHGFTVGEVLRLAAASRLCFAPAPDRCRRGVSKRAPGWTPRDMARADLPGVLYWRCALSDRLWYDTEIPQGKPFSPVLEHKCFRTRTSRTRTSRLHDRPSDYACRPF
jgi:hypothetical protein